MVIDVTWAKLWIVLFFCCGEKRERESRKEKSNSWRLGLDEIKQNIVYKHVMNYYGVT